MGRTKFSAEKKVEIVQAFKSGEVKHSQLREVYGMNPGQIYVWIKIYEMYGIEGFNRKPRTTAYTKEFKTMCAEEYLRGEESTTNIALKYGVSSGCMISEWASQYRRGEELKPYNPKEHVYVRAKRKTTLAERNAIADDCIAHGLNYKETADLYDVSYDQVYGWVKSRKKSNTVS